MNMAGSWTPTEGLRQAVITIGDNGVLVKLGRRLAATGFGLPFLSRSFLPQRELGPEQSSWRSRW